MRFFKITQSFDDSQDFKISWLFIMWKIPAKQKRTLSYTMVNHAERNKEHFDLLINIKCITFSINYTAPQTPLFVTTIWIPYRSIMWLKFQASLKHVTHFITPLNHAAKNNSPRGKRAFRNVLVKFHALSLGGRWLTKYNATWPAVQRLVRICTWEIFQPLKLWKSHTNAGRQHSV